MTTAERNGKTRRAAAPDDEAWIERHRRPALIAAILTLIAFAAVMGYAYKEGRRAVSAEPPLIRAPEGPLKVKPEDPGGMVVPDRDKLVYKRVKGEEPGSQVQLRPGPELPIKRPEPKPAAKPEQTPVTTPNEEAATVEAAPEITQEIAPEVSEAAVAPPEPPTAPAAADSIYIQLGAVGDQTAAVGEWSRLQQRHAVLKSLSPVIAPLTKDNGQILYRLRAGPLADRAAATKICEELKASNQPCFIAAP